jgi:hypothetical protein
VQCWRTELYGEGLNQWKIVKSEQSEDINDIISDALFNLLNCLRRWLLIIHYDYWYYCTGVLEMVYCPLPSDV